MTQQTYLKLLVVCGYYDFATPFNGIEQTVNHMGLEPEIRKNVSFQYYEGGHMMYIDKKANTNCTTMSTNSSTLAIRTNSISAEEGRPPSVRPSSFYYFARCQNTRNCTPNSGV